MKRLLLAMVILTVGTTVFCAFQSSTRQLQRDLATRREEWMSATQLVADVRLERDSSAQRVRELKRSIASLPPLREPVDCIEFVATNHSQSLPSEFREKLLEELGFNWNSTGEFLVVSKDTLRSVGCRGVNNNQLSETAARVLALTAEERAAVNTTMQRMTDEYDKWFTEHIQRIEPEGDVVAKYVIPRDEAFSQSSSNRFMQNITAALGAERAGLLRDYAYSWMNSIEMLSSEPAELIVRRESSDAGPRYRWTWKSSTAGWSVQYMTPYQFPEKFRQLFPNGWADMAKREGFELPKEFQKKGK